MYLAGYFSVIVVVFWHVRGTPAGKLASGPKISNDTITEVWTSSGRYTGHPPPQRSNVTEFLGIRYGQPPTGTLRFAAPLAFVSNESIQASTQPDDCPYVARNWGSVPGESYTTAPRIMAQESANGYNAMDEDCLKLNIWSPTSSADLKPVMVFLYGGGFDRGSVNNPAYIGANLAADEDVVVVTFNYRVNIFGFSNAPGADQNVGLRDVRLAVEWVRDNIHAFGGDISRITLFGQSQGAYLISYYAYAFPDDPIASSFIQQSGSAFSTIQQNATTKTDIWNAASAAVGCNSTSETSVLTCMRAQNVSTVLAAWAAVQPEGDTSLPFGPVVDNELIFANYTQQTLSGDYAQLPLLLGSNENEAGFYVLRYAGTDQFTLTQEQQNEIGFGLYYCPIAQDANTKAAALAKTNNTIPVHRYLYFGDWPNLRLYAGSGAYHTSETSVVFGTMEDLGGQPNTVLEVAVSRYMQSAWAAFARDPINGLSGFGWPAYNETESTLIRLGLGNDTTASFAQPGTYDAICAAL